MFVKGFNSLTNKAPIPALIRSLATRPVKTYPSDVTIVEVGPRDGLQNEKVNPSKQEKCL